MTSSTLRIPNDINVEKARQPGTIKKKTVQCFESSVVPNQEFFHHNLLLNSSFILMVISLQVFSELDMNKQLASLAGSIFNVKTKLRICERTASICTIPLVLHRIGKNLLMSDKILNSMKEKVRRKILFDHFALIEYIR